MMRGWLIGGQNQSRKLEDIRLTWRLGIQVGLSPRFSLSMSSALSETG